MNLPRRSTWCITGLLILGAALLFPVRGRLAAQSDEADARRLAEQLQVRPGMHLAEIGAGAGSLTVALARAVGPTGLVYSNELSSDRRAAIRQTVARAGLSNVTVVEGQPEDAALPEACCDGVFMRNVYHHFGNPAEMNRSLWRSLKPGGRLAIIDFPPRGGREAATPDERDSGQRHGVSPDTVQRELGAAGFSIVTVDSPREARWFMVVAEKR
jgi:ubiquinone/menaquinone biosynthesis C-methylase UbiE